MPIIEPSNLVIINYTPLWEFKISIIDSLRSDKIFLTFYSTYWKDHAAKLKEFRKCSAGKGGWEWEVSEDWKSVEEVQNVLTERKKEDQRRLDL